jgi:geranylgeranyl pyrophosphate synthase
MDLYQSTTDYLLVFPIFDAWPEMSTILRRAASTRPRDWQLPIIACQAAGGFLENAIPASAALACAQISIILVDDMLDHDPRGEYHRIGYGNAANFAMAFQSAGMDAVVRSTVNSKVKSEALNSLNQMMLRTAHGQDLDFQNPADENSYWRVVENKSVPFYECALNLGALFSETTNDIVRSLDRLGQLYGEMIQIHDDLNDTMAVPANPDWIQGRKPLPILFALSVDHPNRTRFSELYQRIADENALQEAQEILIKCGAVSYCVDQLIGRYQAAEEILNQISLPDKEAINSLIEAVIAPVWKLFETLGLSLKAPPTIAKRFHQA